MGAPDGTGAGADGSDTVAPDQQVGALLRAFRTRRLLTQEGLSRRTGISVRTVRNLESGGIRRPRSETLQCLGDGMDLTAAERLLLRQALAGPVAPPAPVPARQPPSALPPSTWDFCGREPEITAVIEALTPRDGLDGALVACAVTGKPGVGKTALLLHVAHELRAAGRFPDGQLYVNLQGAGPAPLAPAEVLARFLDELGVDAAELPDGVQERADRLRTVLAGRRVLLVLDDAASEAQVRPLLPGAGGNAVLIAGRVRLTGLEGVPALHLDVLPPSAAVGLLSRVVGAARVDSEPDAAATIATYCGLLPLAIRIAGARLAARPDWTLPGLAQRLADERRRLDELATGDLEVRASFALSYDSLSRRGQQLFRRFALLDTADVPEWVVAALLDVSQPEAERAVERLVDASLVEIAGRDGVGQTRYRLHDLLRVYAAELVGVEPAAERDAARSRVAGGWLALVDRAVPAVRVGTMGLVHGPAPRWSPGPPVIDLVRRAPLDWLEAEHAGMAATVVRLSAEGRDEAAWDLAGSLALFYMQHSHFDDWRRSQLAGLEAARRSGSRTAEAHLLRGLGNLFSEQERLDLSTDCLRRARDIFAETGDRPGEAGTLDDLGVLYHLNGRTELATAALRRAEALFGEAGDDIGQAHVRFSLGVLHLDQGEHDAAEARLTEARSALADSGDLYTLAAILRKLAQLHRTRGQLEQAVAVLGRCLEVDRAAGDRLGEALTLQSLGEVRRRQDRSAESLELLGQALGIFRDTAYSYGEALVLGSLARLHLADDQPGLALSEFRTSLSLWRALGRPRNEAHTLTGIAEAHAVLGAAGEAERVTREALRLYDQIGAPEAGTLAARLA